MGLIGNIRSDHPNIKATLNHYLFTDGKSITQNLPRVICMVTWNDHILSGDLEQCSSDCNVHTNLPQEIPLGGQLWLCRSGVRPENLYFFKNSQEMLMVPEPHLIISGSRGQIGIPNTAFSHINLICFSFKKSYCSDGPGGTSFRWSHGCLVGDEGSPFLVFFWNLGFAIHIFFLVNSACCQEI